MNRHLFTLSLICLLLVQCKTIKVEKTHLADAGSSGTVYKLPKAQLLFEINVKKTTYTKNPKGCFDNYKEFFAGIVSPDLLQALDSRPSVVTAKVSSAVISPFPVDDEDKFFTIKVNNNLFNKSVTGVSMDDNGILSKGDFSSENMVIPVVSQLISSAAGFVSPFTLTKSAAAMVPDANACSDLYNKYLGLDNAKSEFMFLTPFKNASELPTKEMYERVLTEYEKEKSNLFTQLMFSTEVQQDKVVIRFTPSADKNGDLVNGKLLFGFKKNGDQPELYINSDLVGPTASFVISSPGVLLVESTEVNMMADKALKKYQLSIVPVAADKEKLAAVQARPAAFIKKHAPSDEIGGLYYNIPLNCKVYLQQENKNWSEATLMLPQWGTVARLNSKRANQVVELNPLYGNLKSIKEQNQNVSPDQLKTLGQSLNEARDVFYTDPITKMERRIKYLETQTKLTEAEGTELTKLREQIELLKAQKEAAELKKALKEFEL